MEYLIRVTRTTEFETRVEADDPLAAADMAKMEATGNSVITNEWVDITLPENIRVVGHQRQHLVEDSHTSPYAPA